MTVRFHRLAEARPEHIGMDRRTFLATTSMVGATLMAGADKLLAATLDKTQADQLLRMVQDIYPHPKLLTLAHYQTVAATVTSKIGADAAKAVALKEGLVRINAKAQALHGKPYTKITDANSREGVLRHFQNEAFFQNVRWAAYFAIYDNKKIWPLFGYEGSSVEHGGYIDRGFSDITFVPKGPTLKERLAQVKS